jgi:hypothetical protein
MKPYASLKETRGSSALCHPSPPRASWRTSVIWQSVQLGRFGKGSLASEDRVDDVLQCPLRKAWGRCSDGKDPIRSIRSYTPRRKSP